VRGDLEEVAWMSTRAPATPDRTMTDDAGPVELAALADRRRELHIERTPHVLGLTRVAGPALAARGSGVGRRSCKDSL